MASNIALDRCDRRRHAAAPTWHFEFRGHRVTQRITQDGRHNDAVYVVAFTGWNERIRHISVLRLKRVVLAKLVPGGAGRTVRIVRKEPVTHKSVRRKGVL